MKLQFITETSRPAPGLLPDPHCVDCKGTGKMVEEFDFGAGRGPRVLVRDCPCRLYRNLPPVTGGLARPRP